MIKGHYSDNVTNPEAYPEAGLGAANVGPEFTELEYNGLMELDQIQNLLVEEGKMKYCIPIRSALWEAVINSGRWKKWIQPGENPDDFYSIPYHRQEWLIKTGCRYIWEDPAIVSVRKQLYDNLSHNGIEASTIVELSIESAMDKYFYKFNLVGLNSLL